MDEKQKALSELGKLLLNSAKEGGILQKVNNAFADTAKIFLKHKAYSELAASWRGKVINMTIDLELSIDEFLGSYFSPKNKKKKNEIIKMIFKSDSYTLNKKINLCRAIFKDYPKYDGVINFKDIDTYLDKIRETRNVVAHSDIDSVDFLINLSNNTSVFKKYTKSKTTPFLISDEIFNEFSIECAKSITFFDEWAVIICNPIPYKVIP